ncbi:hypothetical protein [Peribacillus simplex]|uniref:hypothetical protein n=1 Tax=Peribacillus simplex TaxID=1478 RepID=UPI003D2E4A51
MTDKKEEILEIAFKISAKDLASYLTDFQLIAHTCDEEMDTEWASNTLEKNALYKYLSEIYFKTEYWKQQEAMQKRISDKWKEYELAKKVIQLPKKN